MVLRSVPFQGHSSAVPGLFEDAPAAFDGVVLTVVRRAVDPFEGQAGAVRELDQAFEERGARAAEFRPVVEFDHQPRDARMRRFAERPPPLNRVDENVGGLSRASEEEVEWMDRGGPARHFPHAERDEQRRVMPVVIQGLGLQTRTTAAREFPDLDRGFRVDRDPQAGVIGGGAVAGSGDVCEDRVGLGDLLGGFAFRTRPRAYPLRLSITPTVSRHGTAPRTRSLWSNSSRTFFAVIRVSASVV